MSAVASFRELLKRPGIIRSLGAHDVFTARLVEAAGLETVFIGGFGTSASMLGLPDVGYLTLTEMTDAFKIGFLLYIAFIIVDLVIANVLMAMGLNQVQPTNIAIPFKLLLFVVMDGWSALMHGLVLTYR